MTQRGSTLQGVTLVLQLGIIAGLLYIVTQTNSTFISPPPAPTEPPKEIVQPLPDTQVLHPLFDTLEDDSLALRSRLGKVSDKAGLIHNELDSMLEDIFTVPPDKSLYDPEITQCLQQLVDEAGAKVITETQSGFGYSTATLLTAASDVTVLSFDPCTATPSSGVHSIMASAFGLRHRLVCGESKQAISSFIAHNPLTITAYDLVRVNSPDPDHELERIAFMVKDGGLVLLENCDSEPARSTWSKWLSGPKIVQMKVREPQPDGELGVVDRQLTISLQPAPQYCDAMSSMCVATARVQ
eukprot:TRINITY_DN67416_c10_g11_i1.p1 TRINITY_DN67416_c10_g11~~TRINITY_DN67416_c10_g11_i1.p1  ORF type:complete len:298 (-),score=6.68 TRINITY_DN67416_c10_g11_i1:165-1058(-)